MGEEGKRTELENELTWNISKYLKIASWLEYSYKLAISNWLSNDILLSKLSSKFLQFLAIAIKLFIININLFSSQWAKLLWMRERLWRKKFIFKYLFHKTVVSGNHQKSWVQCALCAPFRNYFWWMERKRKKKKKQKSDRNQRARRINEGVLTPRHRFRQRSVVQSSILHNFIHKNSGQFPVFDVCCLLLPPWFAAVDFRCKGSEIWPTVADEIRSKVWLELRT